MPRENSAGAIIYRKEDSRIYYLLLHYKTESRRGGHWGFAKGHIEQGETEEKTTKREIAEETGIKDIKIIPGFKEFEKYFFRKNYGLSGEARKKAPWIFKLVVFYLVKTNVKEVKLSEEHDGFLWLPLEAALKKITFKNAKKLLIKANKFIGECN